MKKGRHEAFTLVELLVVIAVIAILAALLLPALHRAKDAADSAVCRNNLRQIGAACSLYVGDFGAYPPGDYSEESIRNWGQPYDLVGWQVSLWKYAGIVIPRSRLGTAAGWSTSIDTNYQMVVKRTIFSCPGYAKTGGILGGQGGPGVAYGYNKSGVAQCWWPTDFQNGRRGQLGLGGEWLRDPLSGAWNSVPSSLRCTRENEILSPSEMLTIGDSYVTGSGPMFGDSDLADPVNWSLDLDGYASLVKRRHNSRWNLLFCDGHVQMLRLEQLADAQNDHVRRLWNKDHEPHWEFPSGR